MERLIDLVELLADALDAPGPPRRVRREGVIVDTTGPGLPACVTIVEQGACLLRIAAVAGVTLAPGGGWLVRTAVHDGLVIWLPLLPRRLSFDAAGHVLHLAPQTLAALQLGADALEAGFAGSADSHTELVAWGWRGDASSASALERAPWYMLGSHTTIDGRAAAYRHLVGGRVFENRRAWPHGWRIVSENDAHALHLVLSGLLASSPDRQLLALRRQLVLATLERQDADGGYRHGEWTDRNESHYRLHCSAMHLMMDELAHVEGEAHAHVISALAAAAAFLARQAVQLSFGSWFLHDELEHSVELMRLGPFRWVPSRSFGKDESNMLVLNSHLDATVALDRYAQISGDGQYAELVLSARAATRAVLGLRGAPRLYRAVFALVGPTFLPHERAAALPAWQRALKRLAWQHLIPRLPDLKARWPRLVMPGGYIDRELTLRTFAHDYHAVNLMDLARYLRRFPDDAIVRDVLVGGLAFARDSGILERWAELDGARYALGFWAEALYHVCTLFPESHYRAWLAEAMLMLEDLQLGLPPSLLGANAEAIHPAQQTPCPSPTDACLRIANLGRRGAPELLIVNPGPAALPLAWEVPPAEAVDFHCADGGVAHTSRPVVSARSWLWGRAAN